MENTFCVYCHINRINNKKYYGQTKWGQNPEYRWGKNGGKYRKNKHFWGAIHKYGWDSFEHVIIKNNLTLEEANQLETELILKDKTYDENYGYNCDLGGNNRLTLEKTKQKLSQIRMGKEPWNKGLVGVQSVSDETKEKIRIASKKRWEDEDYRIKNIKSRTGLKRSDTFKAKQSENAKGNTNVRGMHWYNNGIAEIRAYECPEGYIPGRCKNKET